VEATSSPHLIVVRSAGRLLHQRQPLNVRTVGYELGALWAWSTTTNALEVAAGWPFRRGFRLLCQHIDRLFADVLT
jgi:hypothetical protein